jgi:CHAD domain-containing protein
MTLDVPTHAYVVPAGVDADTMLSFLGERLDLVADPPVTVEATVYDTVDRRLRDEGLEAQVEGARENTRLVLREGAGRPPLVAPLGDQASDRYQAPELPEGPVRDRVAPVLEERALLPLVKLRMITRAVSVRNQDEKTVARLSVVTPAAVFAPDPAEAFTGGARHAPDGPITLATRVTVAGVLGYPKPLARVVELLDSELGLHEVGRPMADEALEALGGDPAGLASKVKLDLDPAQRTDEAAVAVLTALAGITEANIAGTLADLDTEFLHDLRVSVRRARSVLREMKKAFAPEPLQGQRDALKWVQAITGDTRDLDVQLLEWPELAEKVAPDRRAALEPVHVLVAEHRAEAVEALRDELKGTGFTAAWASYRAFLAGDLGPEDDRPDAARPIAKTAGRRIRKVYGRMVEMGGAITDGSPAEDLHELRKRGKELRYLLELFGGLWPTDVVKPMVKTLKGLQDVLGTHQDRAVQVESLRALSGELARRPDGPNALLALGTLVDRLEDEQEDARAHFAERFAPFAAKSQQKLVDQTFRGMP